MAVRKVIFVVLLIVLLWISPSASRFLTTPGSKQAPIAAQRISGNLPISFERNLGQANQEVKFLAHGAGYSLLLKPTEAVIELPKTKDTKTSATLQMKLIGANQKAQIQGLEELPGSANYFLGNAPQQWRNNVPTYAKVQYQNIYPGIDLIYYGNQQQLEYDFVVSPAANPSKIQFQFADAASLRLEPNGDLIVSTAAGEMRQHKPFAFQELSGTKQEVSSRFVINGKTVSFALGKYDSSKPLVIDPVLSYATLLGGGLLDTPEAMAVDAQGNVYVTGSTYYRDQRGAGVDFPTTNGAIKSNGTPPVDNGTYIFVSKLNPTGTALIYSAIIGGTKGFPYPGFGPDLVNQGNGIAVDDTGSAYITGLTQSLDFPTTPGVIQPTAPVSQTAEILAFAFKLNPAGSALSYSTLLGSGDDTRGQAIAIDRAGQAWITGSTYGRKFQATSNAWQRASLGTGITGFVAKLSATADRLLYASYLSSGSQDAGTGVAVDSTGAAYVTGQTSSSCLRPDLAPVSPFPTTEGAFQRDPGAGCMPTSATSYAFVAKFSADNTVVYSTLIRGAAGNAIGVDTSGAAYVAGKRIGGLPFPVTPGAFQTEPPAGQLSQSGFVTKLNPNGTGVLYSTYFSGSVGLFGNLKMTVDTQGRACLTGAVSDSTFVTTTQDEPFGARRGAFVTRFNAEGSALDYSVVFGDTYTGGRAIAVDANGEVYVSGASSSASFPTTPSAYQPRVAGDNDVFLMKVTTMRPVSSVSAASYMGATLAGNSIVAAFGQDLTTTTLGAGSGSLPTELSGLSVRVRDALGIEHLAPLFFISPNQINYLIPPETASGAATVIVVKDGVATSGGSTTIAPVAPGLFTANSDGRGVPAALVLYVKPDSSLRYAPVARYDEASKSFVAMPIEACATGEDAYLILFGTGIRQRSSLASVAVKMAGIDTAVSYAGEQGVFTGLDQINVPLPRNLCGRGEAEVALTVDGKPANLVKIFIK